MSSSPKSPHSLSEPLRTDHLRTLLDDVGIVQHAHGIIPNRTSGYCVDDVARLVVVASHLNRQSGGSRYRRVLALALSFLRHAWDSSGSGMNNFMSYDRRWIDGPGRGDHLGRSVWAFSEVSAEHTSLPFSAGALALLGEMEPLLRERGSLRETAFITMGLARVPFGILPDALEELLPILVRYLIQVQGATQDDDWCWFEDELTYDNARLPQALIVAGVRLVDSSIVDAGLKALDWYGAQCSVGSGTLQLIGNHWRRRHELPASPGEEGIEQPLDASALVEAYVDAFVATNDQRYLQNALIAFEWFIGRNRLGLALYDSATGGCRDGLCEFSLNNNEGAESTLAYFQAALALRPFVTAVWQEHQVA